MGLRQPILKQGNRVFRGKDLGLESVRMYQT